MSISSFLTAGGVLAISTSGRSPACSLLGLAVPSGLMFGCGRPYTRQVRPALWQAKPSWAASLLRAMVAVHGTDH